MRGYDFEAAIELLAMHHPMSEADSPDKDPYEPYRGVIRFLCNGDFRLRAPEDVPREDWIVVSPFKIVYEPVETVEVGDNV